MRPEEIFALGADLLNAPAQRPTHKPMRVVAGIDDVVPKEFAQRLVNAALKQLRQESGLKELGPARKVRSEFYAISME